jgi:hypothetical protein
MTHRNEHVDYLDRRQPQYRLDDPDGDELFRRGNGAAGLQRRREGNDGVRHRCDHADMECDITPAVGPCFRGSSATGQLADGLK